MTNSERLAHNLAMKWGARYSYKNSREHFNIPNINEYIKELEKIIK